MSAPKTYRVLIIRPFMMREQFAQLGAALQLKPELAEWAVKLIKMTMNATRSDIDNGASGRIMVDENFIPTGEPPPDPEGAYCLICKVRIWEHDDNTAYPTHITYDDDGVDVGGGGCCPQCSAMSNPELFNKLMAAIDARAEKTT